jgi:hypothetical protein
MRLPVNRSQQDVRLSDKRGILPSTRNSWRDIETDGDYQKKWQKKYFGDAKV